MVDPFVVGGQTGALQAGKDVRHRIFTWRLGKGQAGQKDKCDGREKAGCWKFHNDLVELRVRMWKQ